MRDRTISRIGRLAAAALLLATLSVTQTASTMAAERHGSKPDAYDRLARSIESLEPRATELWPESFGGIWLSDKGREHGIYVAFTGEAAEKVEQLSKDFHRPRLLRAVNVEYPIGELEALQHSLSEMRPEFATRGLPEDGIDPFRFDSYIEAQTNSLIVRTPNADSSLGKALSKRFGPMIGTESKDLTVPKCADRVSCGPHLRSGLRIKDAPSSYCSSGFAVRRGAVRYLLSAGHCGPLDRTWYHGYSVNSGTSFGSTVARQVGGRTDVMRVPVGNGFTAQGLVYRANDSKSWVVTSRGSWASLAANDQFCMSGATTGRSCGKVLSKYYSADYLGVSTNRFVLGTYCEAKGDSGAGIYRAHQAIGIHSGGDRGSCTVSMNTTHEGVFGHIEYALTAMNAAMVFWP